MTSGAALAADDLVACRSPGQIGDAGDGRDGWTRIAAPLPDVDEGSRAVTAFTAAPSPNRLYVTNGTVVKHSADGGCTWNLVDDGSAVRVPGGRHEADIFTHLAAPTDNILWMASYDDAAGVTRPHVLVAENLAPDAKDEPAVYQADTGLPPVGRPAGLLASRTASGVVYLLVEEPPDPSSGDVDTPTRRLYVSTVPNNPPQLSALGLVWREVPTPGNFGRIEGIALGGSGRSLWAWSKDQVATTPDGTLEAVAWTKTPVRGTIVAGDVNDAGVALLAVEGEQGHVVGQLLTRDARLAGQLSLPVKPLAITHGRRATTWVVSGERGTFGLDPYVRRWIDITPERVDPLADIEMAAGRANRIVLARVPDAVYRFDTYYGESFLPSDRRFKEIDIPDLPYGELAEPYFDPVSQTVTIRPGEIDKVPVTFGMPATVTPLDVYFLVDTTTSMQSAIESLRNDIKKIADGMREALGQSACFGVGDVKDFDVSTDDPTTVFRTHQRIVCEEDESLPLIGAALAKLKSGGGGDYPEAQTVALNQMLTGEGHTTPPVLPGHQAGFRHEAYKVVVLISDSSFSQDTGYPRIDATGHTLRVNEIKVVNVLVLNSSDPAPARADMAAIAEATDSLAPPGGVDCDGDGAFTQWDVAEGEPLICDVSGTEPKIGKLIISLLLGVKDPGTVAVGIDDPHRVVREPIEGATSKILNLKRDVELSFEIPVSCTPEQAGLDLPITLTPTVREIPVGLRGEIVVACRADKTVPPPPRRPELPEPPGPAPIVQPPRIPVVIVPPPPPNPPAQPPANINLNAGLSTQEEQQVQLATVTQGTEEEMQEEVELAMSARETDTSATPVAAFLAGAAMISTATAVAYRRRLQRSARPAYVRVR